MYLRIKVTDPTMPHMSTPLHRQYLQGYIAVVTLHACCIFYGIIPSNLFSGYLNQIIMITKELGSQSRVLCSVAFYNTLIWSHLDSNSLVLFSICSSGT